MSLSVSRNGPCPCGSGRKYKRCHGALSPAASAEARPDVARADALKALDVSVGNRLLRFARRRHGADWLAEALDFSGLLDDGLPTADEMSLIIPWVMHFVPQSVGGLALAQEWRRQEDRRLSSDEHLLLDAYETAWMSIWEVTSVERGVGSTLRDLLTHEERFVLDARSSSTLERFDSVLAIVLSCDGVSFFGGVHGQPLPPRSADEVVRGGRRSCGVRTRPASSERLRDPEIQLALLMSWNFVVDVLRRRPPPRLTNTDGDPLLLTTDGFALLAPREAVAQRLASLAGVGEPEEEEDQLVFAITKPGNATHRSWDSTVVARVVLSDGRLVLETNSTRRADSLRALVQAHLAGMVAPPLRAQQNMEQLMTQAPTSEREQPGRERFSPEEADAVRAFRQQAMADWLDEAVPALAGLTPRKAMQSPGGRAKVALLLKEFERHEMRLSEDERLDLGFVHEALGFSERKRSHARPAADRHPPGT